MAEQKKSLIERWFGSGAKPAPDPEPQIDDRPHAPVAPHPSAVPTEPGTAPPREIDPVIEPEPDIERAVEADLGEPLAEEVGGSAPAPAEPVAERAFAEEVEPPPPPPSPPAVSILPEPVPSAPAEPRQSWFERMRSGLARTSGMFTRQRLDAATLDDLEDLLIQSDIGVTIAMRITEEIGRRRHDRSLDGAGIRMVVAQEVERAVEPVARPLVIDRAQKPFVILMVGVNGSGKTTTIGKLTRRFTRDGLKVWLAAGDTFRAAAVEQLAVWAERNEVPITRKELGADAAGLAFEAYENARAAGADVLLVDTAGRLQNKAELMSELGKVTRVIRKIDASAPHAVLLVLDATTGQNAIGQVEAFRNTAGVTGLVMTKLDGTARGGILVAVAEKFGLPVHFIGVGEAVEDLEAFDAREFSRALVGLDREGNA